MKCFFKNNSEVFLYNLSKMISSTIKNRTQSVNKQLNQVWCEKWMEYIIQHPDHSWNWYLISRNSSLIMEYVEQHPEHHWDWDGISQNSSLTMEDIMQHPEHPWNWCGISQNSSLTMEYVEQHPEHPWYWFGISQNVFKKDRQQLIEKKYREHLSAFKIQKWFRKIAENPNHKSGICKRRVYATYDKLFNIVENE